MVILELIEIDNILHKQCTHCKEWKPADENYFSPYKYGKQKLTPRCRSCAREYSRIHRIQRNAGIKVRKRTPLAKDAPPIKTLLLPEDYKIFYSNITSRLPEQARFKAYLITCKETNQHYVGITERKLEKRWMQHLREALRQGGYLLHDAISHYGIWSFEFNYIANAQTRSDLHELEKQLIAQYKTVENGYNQTRGGSAGEAVGKQVTVSGQSFISINSAARHFDLDEFVVHQRMFKYGWSLEEALGIEPRPDRIIHGKQIEVEEIIFPNLHEACKHYGQNFNKVYGRFESGWDVNQAFSLAAPPIIDWSAFGKEFFVDGKTFSSISKAADEYKLAQVTVQSRLRYGWTPEQAVGIHPPPRSDRNNGTKITVAGVTYSSQTKAAESYGLDRSAVQGRLKNGWSIEQAFGLALPPPPPGEKNGKPLTVAGVTYSSLSKAATTFGIRCSLVQKRLKKLGWTIEQALGIEWLFVVLNG